MSQIEKLIEKLKNTRGEANARDIENLLKHMGFMKERQRGSHIVFSQGQENVGFVVHNGKVKIVYLKDILVYLKLL